jgi:hypothetical protein
MAQQEGWSVVGGRGTGGVAARQLVDGDRDVVGTGDLVHLRILAAGPA